jgi:hypothetical protein
MLKRRIENYRVDKFTPKDEFLKLNERKESNKKSIKNYEPLSSVTLPIINVS